MSANIERHLQELGFFPVTTMQTVEELAEVDQGNYTLEKGYYNDPTDEYGNVAF